MEHALIHFDKHKPNSGVRFSHHHLHTITTLSGRERLHQVKRRRHQSPMVQNKLQPARFIRDTRPWEHQAVSLTDLWVVPILTVNSSHNFNNSSMEIIRSNQTLSGRKGNITKLLTELMFLSNLMFRYFWRTASKVQSSHQLLTFETLKGKPNTVVLSSTPWQVQLSCRSTVIRKSDNV